jgi:hypothetical protein
MDAKLFVILFSVSFGLMLIGAVIGNALESSGALTREHLGPKGIALIMAVYGALFCLMAFSLVPLALKVFIALQIKIGNAEHFLVKWLRANERAVVYGFWGLFVAGLVIAFALAREEILKQLK